jgi:hypothetical protein
MIDGAKYTGGQNFRGVRAVGFDAVGAVGDCLALSAEIE